MAVGVLGESGDTPRDLIRRAQTGDPDARQDLLVHFEPLILRIASRVVGRYLRKGQDDEISIALIAFDEAIRAFDPDRGRGFTRFAEQVIRRRLVDHYRRTRNHEVAFSVLEEEDEQGSTFIPARTQAAIEQHAEEVDAEERREEIVAYAEALKRYGISFEELSRISPKHEDSRRSAMMVARRVAEDPTLRARLRERGELPLKELEQMVSLSRKTLERQRRYIIAVGVLLMGDFPHLSEYVRKR
jgi:RNA polymerase sigma factor